MLEQLTIDEFRVVREHLREACGLYFADDKYPRVVKVIGARMAEIGLEYFADYQRVLTRAPKSKDELAAIAVLLTVGETHFFRNKDHWHAFAECVLPWILERNAAASQRRIRIWSAGCSTGEEAYTASIVLNETLPDLGRWSIEIIGTDLNPAAIAAAKRAIYTEHSFRGVPAEIKRKHFEPVEAGRYRPRADIRAMVRFQEMNLLDPTAAARMRDVDVIFCRNVLSYFDRSGVQRVMTHFQGSIVPGGYLFLGHAENAHGSASGFASMNVCNTFIYKSIPRPAPDLRSLAIPQPVEDQPVGQVTAKSPAKTSRRGDQWPPEAATRRREPKPALGVREGMPTPDSLRLGNTGSPRKPATPAANAAPVAPCLDTLRGRAIEYFCAEENAKAQKTLEEILRREPDDPESLIGMALLLADSGRSDAAIEYCQRALGVRPMWAEAYCVMALVHEGLGADASAQRELEKALYLDDGFAFAHFRLAGVHNRAGRQDAATREFNNTLKALLDDDELRLRLYSRGFSKEAIARICEQRLGIESATVQTVNASERVGKPAGIEGIWV